MQELGEWPGPFLNNHLPPPPPSSPGHHQNKELGLNGEGGWLERKKRGERLSYCDWTMGIGNSGYFCGSVRSLIGQ